MFAVGILSDTAVVVLADLLSSAATQAFTPSSVIVLSLVSTVLAAGAVGSLAVV
jgi:hypothetical protein